MKTKDVFYCKDFAVVQDANAMKVNSDSILLGAWAHTDRVKRVLDIGTGTGIISLMMAQKNKSAEVIGVEIDKDAASEAAYNFAHSPWKERLQVIHMPIQDYARQQDAKFDLIVSNPPFFSGGTFSANTNRSSVRHTTKLSHGDLLIAVHKLLDTDGKFEIILPYLEGERLIDRAKRYDLYEDQVTELRPFAGKPIERLLISLTRENKDPAPRTTLVMYEMSGDERLYTGEYKDLTSDFYLNL